MATSRRRKRPGELIDTATTRLDLMNPYLTDADMLQRLIAAAKRGVHVRVVVSETSNNRYAEAALSHHYRDLIDAGVEVWEYPSAVVHAKIVVADDTVQFGTLNLDAWALYRDFELGLVVQDAATAELFESRVVRSRHRSLAAGQAADRRVGSQHRVGVGQGELFPLTPFLLTGTTPTRTLVAAGVSYVSLCDGL